MEHQAERIAVLVDFPRTDITSRFGIARCCVCFGVNTKLRAAGPFILFVLTAAVAMDDPAAPVRPRCLALGN